jgi:hypothetical protein
MKGDADLTELLEGQLIPERFAHAVQDRAQNRMLVIHHQPGEHDSNDAIVFVPSNQIGVPASNKQRGYYALERPFCFLSVLMIRYLEQH